MKARKGILQIGFSRLRNFASWEDDNTPPSCSIYIFSVSGKGGSRKLRMVVVSLVFDSWFARRPACGMLGCLRQKHTDPWLAISLHFAGALGWGLGAGAGGPQALVRRSSAGAPFAGKVRPPMLTLPTHTPPAQQALSIFSTNLGLDHHLHIFPPTPLWPPNSNAQHAHNTTPCIK